MVLLNPNANWRAITLGCLALAAGCAVFLDPSDGGSAGRTFDHRLHVEDEGLECSSCHIGLEAGEDPGIPTMGVCRLCHDEPEEGDVDPLAGMFDEAGAFSHASFSTLPDEVVFSHAAHVDGAELDCAACHGDVLQSTRLDASIGVTMAECSACHERSAAPNECATCHSEISRDWKPDSHLRGWTTAHGPASMDASDAPVGQCQLCHEQATCTSCHLENPPSDHTNYWRRRGHGALAALDRSRCTTCHQRDTCEECHASTQPASHVGAWGGRRSRHCGSCHLPTSRDEGCFLCHQGTPSHAAATPLPDDHVPGMNCRQCHGVGQPLPHYDNGDVCTACHR